MTAFHEHERKMREQYAQGHLRGLPGQQSGTLGKLRDLMGRRFLIHAVEWAPSRFDKDTEFAVLTVELEKAPGERAKYATSGGWVTRQLQRLTPEDYELIYTVRELTDEQPFNGYYPLVLAYALDTDSQATPKEPADRTGGRTGSRSQHAQA
jgi:hypothetical protein